MIIVRKTRFDKILEQLEKDGKVTTVSPEERAEILSALTLAHEEHKREEIIRQKKSFDDLNVLIIS
jgi:hypothetical protein